MCGHRTGAGPQDKISVGPLLSPQVAMLPITIFTTIMYLRCGPRTGAGPQDKIPVGPPLLRWPCCGCVSKGTNLFCNSKRIKSKLNLSSFGEFKDTQ